jgi:hypothetical protein
MEILNMKIEEILKFPLRGKDWINKFGIYLLITFITSFFVAGFIIFILFAGILLLETSVQMPTASLLLFLLLASPFFLILFLIQIYLQGYLLEIINNVKNKQKDEIPLHNNIAKKISLGFAQFVLWLGPIMFSLILFAFSIVILVAGIVALQSAILPALLLIVFGVITIIFSILLLILVTTFVFPAMLYIYLTTNSLKKAYCFQNIITVIKNAWKEFLLLYAISIITSLFISTIGQIPGFGFLILTLGIGYLAFVVAFVTGNIFQNLDKLKLFK